MPMPTTRKSGRASLISRITASHSAEPSLMSKKPERPPMRKEGQVRCARSKPAASISSVWPRTKTERPVSAERAMTSESQSTQVVRWSRVTSWPIALRSQTTGMPSMMVRVSGRRSSAS